MLSNEDNLLIDKALNKDIEGWEKLIKKYTDEIFNIIYRSIANYSKAAAITEDTILRAVHSLHSRPLQNRCLGQ